MPPQIVAAYGAYSVSDELLNVSGLLAVVALGTWLSAKGQHRISSRVDAPLRTVWCVLSYNWWTAPASCDYSMQTAYLARLYGRQHMAGMVGASPAAALLLHICRCAGPNWSTSPTP